MSPIIRWAPLALAAVIYGATAEAIPYINTTCRHKNPVSTPKNAKGVYFSEDCSTAYVEPPIVGKTEIRALAPTANLDFCESIGEVHHITTRTIRSIDEISKKIEDMIRDYKPLDEALTQLRTEAEVARARSEKAKRELEAAETTMTAMKAEVKAALEAKEDCRLENPGQPEKCREADAQYAAKDKEYREYRLGAYRAYRKAFDEALEEYDELNARVTASAQKFAQAIKPMMEMQVAISDLNTTAFDMYKQYAGLNGATGQMVYSIDWSQLIADYEKLNPHLSGHFAAIPIREGTVWGSVVAPNSENLLTVPAVLSTDLPGLRPAGGQGFGAGATIEPNEKTTPSPTLDGGVISSVSGKVVLTLNGACPFFKNKTEPAKDISFENLSAYLVLNTTFTYEVAARRGYDASYRLSQLMSRFEKYVKKGGFFSTSTSHEVIEDNQSNDWFKFKAFSEDSQYAYTPAEEEELKKTVKAELIDRALKEVAVFNSGGILAPGLLAPGQSGAAAISSGLARCPHLYCQAGALIFGVLDSIFGRKEAVSSFKRNNDVWKQETVRGVRMVDRYATVTFAPEAKLPGN